MPTIYEPTPWNDSVNELYVRVLNKNVLYIDDTGQFSIRDRSGKQYVMVAYHSSDVILVKPRKDNKWLAAYNVIMNRPKEKNLLVDLQNLYN